ncbi:50S ribosomal protein L22 [bacterium]
MLYETVSKARYARISWRKAGQILDVISGKKVSLALKELGFMNKSAVPIIKKVITSGMANLGKNIDPNDVYVKEAYVGQGPSMVRLRPGPMGRGMTYSRKTCHITIKLKRT